MADHEKQAVEAMCRAMCAAAMGKPGYEDAKAWDDWDEESREIGRGVMTSAYRAINAAPDPRDEVIRGLVESAEDAHYDLCQWLECEKSLVAAGFNMDGTADVIAKLDAALSAARKLGVGE